MKTTPFYSFHQQYSAKMVEFAGFMMPISYTGILEEHKAVRTHAGIFDVSHMGEFIVSGPSAQALIQHTTCNDIAKLTAGMAQYNCFINETGGVVDDLIVYCLEPNFKYMLVVNAANIEKDWNYLTTHNTIGATLQDISSKTCLLAIQGPLATRILQPLTPALLSSLKYYRFVKDRLAGVENVLISATGYTGSGGVELYFEDKNDHAAQIWEAILQIGSPQKLLPVGLGARDTLRLEMGYCLYGNELTDSISPLEAQLGWITKMNKNFVGKASLLQQQAQGIQRKLVGMALNEHHIARKGYLIKNASGKPVGQITSGSISPSLNKPIALGLVDISDAALGSVLQVEIRNRLVPATVVQTPFQ